MSDFRKLIVFKKGFQLAMELFEASKKYPKEEMYALVSQIRRSSRAVCSCIAEAYRKRRYEAHFIAKVTDANTENSETLVWRVSHLPVNISVKKNTNDGFHKQVKLESY